MARYSVVRLLDTFFRRWWLYLVPLVALTALGVASVMSTPATYKSVATINVPSRTLIQELSGTDPGFGYETPATATVAQLTAQLTTEVFLTDIATRARLATAVQSGAVTLDKLRSSIGVGASGPNLVKVGATFSDPQIAQLLAQATIDAFVDTVVAANVNQSVAAAAFYDQLVNTYRQDLDATRAALDQFLTSNPTPEGVERPAEEATQLARLQADATDADTKYRSALSKGEDARLKIEQTKADIVNRVRIVDAPKVPIAPLTGKKTLVMQLAVFMALGFTLSAAAVVLAATFDHSVRFESELAEKTGLRVLAVVPSAAALRQGRRRRRRRRANPVEVTPEMLARPVLEARSMPRSSGRRRPAGGGGVGVGGGGGGLGGAPAERPAPPRTRREPAARDPRPAVEAGRPAARVPQPPAAERPRMPAAPPRERPAPTPPAAPTAPAAQAGGDDRGWANRRPIGDAEVPPTAPDDRPWARRRGRARDIPHAS